MRQTYGTIRDIQLAAARAVNFNSIEEGLAISYFTHSEVDVELFNTVFAASLLSCAMTGVKNVIGKSAIKELATSLKIEVKE